MTITIGIKYQGAGATAEVTNKFNAGISAVWSGIFGQYKVTTNVMTVNAGGYFDITVLEGDGRSSMTGALRRNLVCKRRGVGWRA